MHSYQQWTVGCGGPGFSFGGFDFVCWICNRLRLNLHTVHAQTKRIVWQYTSGFVFIAVNHACVNVAWGTPLRIMPTYCLPRPCGRIHAQAQHHYFILCMAYLCSMDLLPLFFIWHGKRSVVVFVPYNEQDLQNSLKQGRYHDTDRSVCSSTFLSFAGTTLYEIVLQRNCYWTYI